MPDEIAEAVVTRPVPVSPETFSREYVSELRNENKGYRLKAQEQETKAKTAEEAATKASAEAEAKITAATAEANARILRAELKAAALKAGMIDLDGIKLADLSTVKINADGEIEGAEELMKSLKESKPYLFQSASTTTQTATPPPKKDAAPTDARTLSKEEYQAKKRELTARK